MRNSILPASLQASGDAHLTFSSIPSATRRETFGNLGEQLAASLSSSPESLLSSATQSLDTEGIPASSSLVAASCRTASIEERWVYVQPVIYTYSLERQCLEPFENFPFPSDRAFQKDNAALRLVPHGTDTAIETSLLLTGLLHKTYDTLHYDSHYSITSNAILDTIQEFTFMKRLPASTTFDTVCEAAYYSASQLFHVTLLPVVNESLPKEAFNENGTVNPAFFCNHFLSEYFSQFPNEVLKVGNRFKYKSLQFNVIHCWPACGGSVGDRTHVHIYDEPIRNRPLTHIKVVPIYPTANTDVPYNFCASLRENPDSHYTALHEGPGLDDEGKTLFDILRPALVRETRTNLVEGQTLCSDGQTFMVRATKPCKRGYISKNTVVCVEGLPLVVWKEIALSIHVDSLASIIRNCFEADMCFRAFFLKNFLLPYFESKERVLMEGDEFRVGKLLVVVEKCTMHAASGATDRHKESSASHTAKKAPSARRAGVVVEKTSIILLPTCKAASFNKYSRSLEDNASSKSPAVSDKSGLATAAGNKWAVFSFTDLLESFHRCRFVDDQVELSVEISEALKRNDIQNRAEWLVTTFKRLFAENNKLNLFKKKIRDFTLEWQYKSDGSKQSEKADCNFNAHRVKTQIKLDFEPNGNASDAAGTCRICLLAFVEGAKLRCLPCLHYYHSDCIIEWLKLKNACPLCLLEL